MCMIEGGCIDVCVGFKVFIIFGDIVFLIEEVFRGRSVVIGVFIKFMFIWWRKFVIIIFVCIGEGKDE